MSASAGARPPAGGGAAHASAGAQSPAAVHASAGAQSPAAAHAAAGAVVARPALVPGPAPHYVQPLLKTPFHNRARALSQRDSFIPWAGYTTVDVFTNVEQEYFAIRNATTLYDLTPMVKYRIAGPSALAYLNRLVTRYISKLKVGRVAYCVWCNDAGHLIDDGTVFRLGENEYRLCTAERQLDWLLSSAIGFNELVIEEVTEQIAALAMQGPTSYAVLAVAGLVGIERLKPFEIGAFDLDGASLMVSRTGFTGDLGYELWMDPSQAERVWDILMAAGSTRGIRAIGSSALNIARIEAGFLQPNVDFVSSAHTVLIGRDRSPLELGLEWLVDFDKPHFTGRRALVDEKRRGSARRLVGLDVDGNKPAHNALLYSDRGGRKEVGSITSATWSPTCKRNIALGIIDAPHFATGSTVWADIYLNRELVWERRMVRARIVDRPFFAPDRRKATPPGNY
ncbi:MAG: aminomethyltransferase family protein [Proteobacteria bacterium]|nr:aminomethyltransferase family protein [Pseudomonadota bacterium]